MGDIRNDPSMEEILASIKRIIAEDGATVVPPAPARPARTAVEPVSAAMPEPDPESEPDNHEEAEPVLELTQRLAASDPKPALPQEPLILSMDSATANQHALSALSSLLVKTKPGEDRTLEGLMREMLKPMLSEWLDARLPGIVDDLVQREIKRITGQQG